MSPHEKAGVQVGVESAPASSFSSLTDEQCDLIARLRDLDDLLEQHRATVALIEMDRLRLRAQLRQAGWRPPPCGGPS